MKKITALFAALVFAFAIVACDDDGDPTAEPTDEAAVEEPVEEETEE